MSEPTITLRIDVTESELECLIETLETHPKNTLGSIADRSNLLIKITAALQEGAPP